MSFLGALTGGITAAVPGASGPLSIITSVFGKHSVYSFVPGHPPGAFRGAAATADYNRRMAALKGGVTSSRNDYGPMIPPGLLAKSSPVMPGGAIVGAAPSGGGMSQPKRRKMAKAKRRSRARVSSRRRRGGRKLSAAQIRAGFGGKRGRKRRRQRD